MPDLIIGGNTYQNIDHIRVQKSNGTIATFVEVANTPSLVKMNVKRFQFKGDLEGKELTYPNNLFSSSLNEIVLMEE